LLGIADEASLWEAVPHGLDTFDSCFPTRIGRHGTLLTSKGPIAIKKGKQTKKGQLPITCAMADHTLFFPSHVLTFTATFARDLGPIDEACSCRVCQTHTRAYLHHLHRAHEPLAETLFSLHNIQYMNDLMARMRNLIMQDQL